MTRRCPKKHNNEGEVRMRYRMSGQDVRESLSRAGNGELKAVRYRVMRAPGSPGAKRLSERFNLEAPVNSPEGRRPCRRQ